MTRLPREPLDADERALIEKIAAEADPGSGDPAGTVKGTEHSEETEMDETKLAEALAKAMAPTTEAIKATNERLEKLEKAAAPEPGGELDLETNDLIASGKLCHDLGLPQLNPAEDRVLICGSPSMLHDLCVMLDGMGFRESPRMGEPADYAIERAFVEK